jgi:hypothetical protein
LLYPVFEPFSDRASREGALRRQYAQAQDAPARPDSWKRKVTRKAENRCNQCIGNSQ